jgi:hypothetical protein
MKGKDPGGRVVVFLSYWASDEPLTVSTVLPTLSMMLREGMADRVVLCTVERSAQPPPPFSIPGCEHVQWAATTGMPKPLARAMDVWKARQRLVALLRRERPALLMARGVIAGGMAHFAAKATGTPYAVDYFEPHADYMADVGEWKRGGLLYRGLQRLIDLQAGSALRMVTVSHNYRRMLMASGVPGERILVAACPVDREAMRFDPSARAEIRAALGATGAPIAIYLGKFGGLYHRELAFKAFARFMAVAGPGSRMIVRTPGSVEEVLQGVERWGGDPSRVHVGYAAHAEVPRWLSAADVAFAPYRGTPSSACISPMKIGEYWANGLPVLLTRGVGDDSGIMDGDPRGGALFDPEGDDLDEALGRVLMAIRQDGQREATASLAVRHRSMELTRTAYHQILAALPVRIA